MIVIVILGFSAENSISLKSQLRGNGWVKSFPEAIAIGAGFRNLSSVSRATPFRGYVDVPKYTDSPVSFLFEVVADGAEAGSECVDKESGLYMLVRENCEEEDNYERCSWSEDDDVFRADLRKVRWKPILSQNWTKIDTSGDLSKNGLLNAAPDGMRSLWFAKSRYLPAFENETAYKDSRCGCSERDPFAGLGWKDRSKSKSRYFITISVADEIKKCDVHFRVRAVEACSGQGVWLAGTKGEYGCKCDLRFAGSFQNPSYGIFAPETSTLGCSRPSVEDGPGIVTKKNLPSEITHDKIECFQTDVRGSKSETTAMSKEQQIACTGVQMTGKRSHREVKLSTSGLSEDEIRYLDETRPSARLRNMLYRQE